jgi:quercetin dioxygenase-like cupin family protein
MNYSRRELSLLLAAMGATRAAAQKSALKSKSYRFEDLQVRAEGENQYRAIFDGATHSGLPIELHITELAPGQAPHPPHHHVHEEMILVIDGTVEVNIGNGSATLGPGSVAFVASDVQHGWHNVGTSRARYFVLALGQDKA